ncbi:MAG: succinate dehydrogenase assembly factor 2 [Ghiorsea sp.]
MGDEQGILIRRLRYRLQRQGMLELDAWLSPLQHALQTKDEAVVQAVDKLTQYEAPDLLAMQAGEIDIPVELKPWLKA